MGDVQGSKPNEALPPYSENEADMPACVSSWPGRGCAPGWDGVCLNCGRQACQPKQDTTTDLPAWRCCDTEGDQPHSDDCTNLTADELSAVLLGEDTFAAVKAGQMIERARIKRIIEATFHPGTMNEALKADLLAAIRDTNRETT